MPEFVTKNWKWIAIGVVVVMVVTAVWNGGV
jgi:hypothetical protein